MNDIIQIRYHLNQLFVTIHFFRFILRQNSFHVATVNHCRDHQEPQDPQVYKVYPVKKAVLVTMVLMEKQDITDNAG